MQWDISLRQMTAEPQGFRMKGIALCRTLCRSLGRKTSGHGEGVPTLGLTVSQALSTYTYRPGVTCPWALGLPSLT